MARPGQSSFILKIGRLNLQVAACSGALTNRPTIVCGCCLVLHAPSRLWSVPLV